MQTDHSIVRGRTFSGDRLVQRGPRSFAVETADGETVRKLSATEAAAQAFISTGAEHALSGYVETPAANADVFDRVFADLVSQAEIRTPQYLSRIARVRAFRAQVYQSERERGADTDAAMRTADSQARDAVLAGQLPAVRLLGCGCLSDLPHGAVFACMSR